MARRTMRVPADLLSANHGTIITLRPVSDRAREWLSDLGEVASEPWQWEGDMLCCEPSYAVEILRAMLADGLSIMDVGSGRISRQEAR